jgi:regulator of protease activity HflC (stomatin/prohibitin superfamily)
MSDSLAIRPLGENWSRGRIWFEKQRRTLMLVLLVAMFVVAALASRIFITIPAGHGGILWLRFFGGTQTEIGALGEGLHIICPWDEIYMYDMRVQEREQSYDVIVLEGLQVTVKSSFRWQLNRPTLAKLHKEIGPNYVEVLLVPEVGSVLRERVAQYNVAELFSSKRSQVQQEILDGVISEVEGHTANRIGGKATAENSEDFVTMTDILLKDIVLPFRLQSAIERKLEQQQISQEYTFRIERERLESQRKQIEAQGIQAFQQTVQAGISDAYLKWRGIEATLQLATSPNAKVVVVGGGSNGLPLILNTDDGMRGPTYVPPKPETAKPAQPADPAKVEKADAENGGRLAGSIDTLPPTNNTSVENLIAPGGVPQGEEAPENSAAAGLDPGPSGNQPPYILRSFADAFGYRLQPVAPATSSVARPNAKLH